MVIKASYSTNSLYFTTGSEDTNFGNHDTGKVEEVSNIDPDSNSNNNKVEDSYVVKLDYVNLCSNSGISNVMVLIGYFIKILCIIVPMIIIILSMIDYFKVVVSNDEKALTKATLTLIRRILSGVVIFIVPTIIGAFTSMILKYDIFGKENQFLGCTNCLLKPSECREKIKSYQK